MKSPTAAANTLRKIFDSTRATTLSLDQVYAVMGRETRDPKKNLAWLANLLTPLRHYRLVKSIYTPPGPGNARTRLSGIALTAEGAAALAKLDGTGTTIGPPQSEPAKLAMVYTAKANQAYKLHPLDVETFSIEPNEMRTVLLGTFRFSGPTPKFRVVWHGDIGKPSVVIYDDSVVEQLDGSKTYKYYRHFQNHSLIEHTVTVRFASERDRALDVLSD